MFLTNNAISTKIILVTYIEKFHVVVNSDVSDSSWWTCEKVVKGSIPRTFRLDSVQGPEIKMSGNM